MDRRVLLEKARQALQTLGHPYVHSAKTIRGLVVDQVGNGHLPDDQLITLFLQSLATRLPSSERLVLNRIYKPDLSMQLAAKRAGIQPVQIGIN
jgi:DNA-directed RNA polymerase specialized sigma subunit